MGGGGGGGYKFIAGFPPRLENRENRENEKCQGKVREFDFSLNVREFFLDGHYYHIFSKIP